MSPRTRRRLAEALVPFALAIGLAATIRPRVLPPRRAPAAVQVIPSHPLEEELWVRYGESGLYGELAKRSGVRLLLSQHNQDELRMSKQQCAQLDALTADLKREAAVAWQEVQVSPFPPLAMGQPSDSEDRAARIARGQELIRQLESRFRPRVDALLTVEQRRLRSKL